MSSSSRGDKNTADSGRELLQVVAASSSSSIYDGVFVHPSVLRAKQIQAATGVELSLTSSKGVKHAIVADIWPRSSLKVDEVYIPESLLPNDTVSWQAKIGVPIYGKNKRDGDATTMYPTAADITLGVSSSSIDGEKSQMIRSLGKESMAKAKYVTKGSVFTFDLLDCKLTATVLSISVSAEDERSATPSSSFYRVTRATNVSLASSDSSSDRESNKFTQHNGTTAALQKERAYATLGGLDSQIEELRKLVELPLRRPDIFRRYGLQPPRGLLLFGPPGTGKTTLAYSAAKACLPASSIETISGPELTSSLHGGTERALRKVFERARKNAPSVVIIDEIDALAPRRDGEAEGSGEVEKRVVATLLTLMDGLDAGASDGKYADQSNAAASRVVVIAATNRPNAIDPALRRPGRLDREIEVGIPSSDARLAILRVLLRNVPHSLKDEQVKEVARRTHGYVGADLSALVREAGMHALSRDVEARNIDLSSQMNMLSFDDDDKSDRDGLAFDDFAIAQTKVRPSAMREITLELPKVTWNDIAPGKAGLDVQRAVRECVEWPLKHRDTMARLGVEAPRGVLLYGPPGCSKTLIARALASESGLNFVAVKGGELINKYVGESERALREVFRKARAASPSIVFFDEIDGLTTSRGGGEGVGDRLVTTLLNEMDGIEQLTNVLVVAATNRPDVLDAALLRPGRLDKLLYVGPPDVEARRQILHIRTRNMALADDVQLDHIADLTQGCSGAEVVSVCQDAGLRAMNESLTAASIKHAHLEAAARQVRRRITPLMLQKYEAWRDQIAF